MLKFSNSSLATRSKTYSEDLMSMQTINDQPRYKRFLKNVSRSLDASDISGTRP